MTQGRPYARQRSTNWSIEFKFKRKYTDASISQQLQTLQHAKVAGGIKNLTPWIATHAQSSGVILVVTKFLTRNV